MNKNQRTLMQVATYLILTVLGFIVLQAIISANYFQPDNLFGEIFPDFSEGLTDIWNVGVALVLVSQGFLLLIVGLSYLYRNWLSIKNGKATLGAQIVWSLIIVAFHLIIIMMLFRATSFAGGKSPVGILVPLTIFIAGTLQAVLAIVLFGPHYNTLNHEV